jgi:phage terminase small subunit
MPLSERRQRFVELFVLYMNAARAAREAGYSEKNAKKEGHRLLGIDEVIEAIEAAKAARSARVQVDQDDVLRGLNAVLNADVGNLVDENNRPLKVKDMPLADRLAIKKVKVTELYEGRGDDRQLIGFTTEFELGDRTRAVDLGMQHLGLKKDTKVKLEGNLKVKAAAGVMLLPAEEIDLPAPSTPAPSSEVAKPVVEPQP